MDWLKWSYTQIVKPTLFQIDPEKAHHLTFAGLKWASNREWVQQLMSNQLNQKNDARLKQTLFGLDFAHPVGLGAGLDKNAVALPMWPALGFSFFEVGTVTPLAQPGNDLPRLFRLPSDLALINRMGFNNDGAQAMLEKLHAFPRSIVPLAVNIGKNKVTSNEDALSDYVSCLRTFYKKADFFVVNISSPNTPNLRELQQSDELGKLIAGLCAERELLMIENTGVYRPMLVKLAPDMDFAMLEATVQTLMSYPIDGIIATNTTITRNGLKHSNQKETGGLSGIPVRQKSTETIRSIYKITKGKMPIIGVGGIFDAEDAYQKIKAGASLIEIYTGLVYKGPTIARDIRQGLLERLTHDGLKHISEAIGVEG